MTTAITQANGTGTLSAETQERVFVQGDLSKLSPAERNLYYVNLCESLGLNPLTRPFEYLVLQGRMVLYARKDATEQLRAKHGISIYRLEKEVSNGVLTVTAYARTPDGREDIDEGAVSLGNLQGDALVNARLRAITKAKRRVTLSICGLGFLDETEIDTIPGAHPVAEIRRAQSEDIPFSGGGDRPARIVTVEGEIVEPPAPVVPPGAATASNDILDERRLKAAEQVKEGIRRTGCNTRRRDWVFRHLVGSTDAAKMPLESVEALAKLWSTFKTIDDVDAYIDRETSPSTATPIIDEETGDGLPF